MRRRLTRDEEFSLMSMILDKFLWLGVFILAFGFWIITRETSVWTGFSVIVAGAVVLLVFIIMLMKQFEYAKL